MTCMVAYPANDGSPFGMGKYSDRLQLPWEQADGANCKNYVFGVPQGCVVRNTFLEWQEYSPAQTRTPSQSGDTSKGQDISDDESSFGGDSTTRSIRRSQSCPGEVFVAGVVEAFRNHDSSPDNSGPENGFPEVEDGDEGGGAFSQLRTSSKPWRRKDLRVEETSQEESWKSPTYGGRSSKSRREERDTPKSGKKGSSAATNVLVLRGLPFTVTEAELSTFIGQAGAKQYLIAGAESIQLINNTQGRPSGFAELHLMRATDYWEVRDKLHMQYFGNRYIEVLPHRRDNLPVSRSYDRDRGNRSSWRR